MKYVIIGGVAAGTKTAARLMRNDRSAQVCIYTKSQEISYAGCGLPYFVGGSIEKEEDLIVNTPEKFSALTGAQVLTGMEAIHVDSAAKTVTFRVLRTDTEEVVTYDKLIICTGAVPFVPTVPGTDLTGVFYHAHPSGCYYSSQIYQRESLPQRRDRRCRIYRSGDCRKPAGAGTSHHCRRYGRSGSAHSF